MNKKWPFPLRPGTPVRVQSVTYGGSFDASDRSTHRSDVHPSGDIQIYYGWIFAFNDDSFRSYHVQVGDSFIVAPPGSVTPLDLNNPNDLEEWLSEGVSQ